jgi:hypothetical protein
MEKLRLRALVCELKINKTANSLGGLTEAPPNKGTTGRLFYTDIYGPMYINDCNF